MRLSKWSIIVLSIILCLPIVMFSQEDVLRPKGKPGGYNYVEQSKLGLILGFEVGLNYNLFSQTNTWLTAGVPHPTAYDCHKSASGASPHFALIADLPLSEKLFLHGRFDVDVRDYSNSGNGYDFDKWENPVILDYDYELKSTYLGLAFLLRYEFTPEFFASTGIDFQFLSGDIEYKQTGSRVDGGDISLIPYWGWVECRGYPACEVTTNVPEAKSSMTGLELGLGYKLALSESIYLVPQARFQLFLTKLASDEVSTVWDRSATDRKLNSVQLALALWFGL